MRPVWAEDWTLPSFVTPQLSIITSIGLDHKDMLGDTIEQIAFEKAGIIKPGVPVVVGDVPQEAFKVISSKAEQCGSRLYRAGDMCEGCVSSETAATEATCTLTVRRRISEQY